MLAPYPPVPVFVCVCVLLFYVWGGYCVSWRSMVRGRMDGCVWCGVPAAVDVEPMVRTKARFSSFICHGRGRGEKEMNEPG